MRIVQVRGLRLRRLRVRRVLVRRLRVRRLPVRPVLVRGLLLNPAATELEPLTRARPTGGPVFFSLDGAVRHDPPAMPWPHLRLRTGLAYNQVDGR